MKEKIKINLILNRIDAAPLWILGILLEVIVFAPYLIMKERSVFIWHDQLDGVILADVLTARHFGEGLTVFPEMMQGLTASSVQPNAILFTHLYRFFTPFVAFTITYAIIFAFAFFGMYFLMRE